MLDLLQLILQQLELGRVGGSNVTGEKAKAKRGSAKRRGGGSSVTACPCERKVSGISGQDMCLVTYMYIVCMLLLFP